MKAVVVEKPGDENALKLGEVPEPSIKPDEILIRVRAAGVNRADILQRQGFYPPPPGASEIIGMEVAGEVVAVGEAVKGWKVGDRAMALIPGGGYAEKAVAHYGSAMKIPATLTFEEAAGIPEVFLTVFLEFFHARGNQARRDRIDPRRRQRHRHRVDTVAQGSRSSRNRDCGLG